ncbi:MAG: PAC2 family protein, partial [Propionibacteriaceae bacterium]|nr:PAC2 family protein [Propionibacteriaceae bacterium]
MLDPRELYSYDSQVRSELDGLNPVLVHLLDGYIDAGSVSHGLRKYILEQCDHAVLAEFDLDQVHDYRYRRPQFVFDTNRLDSMIDFSLAIHRVTDPAGKTFLLLAGPEPDHQWHRVAAGVFEVCQD